jgi:hypothetical protein
VDARPFQLDAWVGLHFSRTLCTLFKNHRVLIARELILILCAFGIASRGASIVDPTRMGLASAARSEMLIAEEGRSRLGKPAECPFWDWRSSAIDRFKLNS